MYKRRQENLPLPKGNSAYALAKRAEYILKDTSLAKAYYWQAIQAGERAESAIKDLASLLHQEGSTREACTLLSHYKHCFTDPVKAENLLKTLEDKVDPRGSCLIKCIKISPISDTDDTHQIRNLFKDSSRISKIEIHTNPFERYALLHFKTHSAARKTANSYYYWGNHLIEWVDMNGNVTGLVENFKKEKNNVMTDPKTAVMLIGRSLFREIFVEN